VNQNTRSVTDRPLTERSTKPTIPPPMRLLDERQVADALGCSVALTRKLRRYGNGPVVTRIGRLVRYCEADVVAFVNANRATAA